MKKVHLIFIMLTTLFLLGSCKKDSTSVPTLTFTNNLAEGTANNSGEYVITGHISSSVRLAKVVLTKEGQATPFLTDESTAKNKNEYDFTYPITGITANTYIIIDVYDQNGGKTTLRFLVKK